MNALNLALTALTIGVYAASSVHAQRQLSTDLRVVVDEGPAEPVGQLRDFAVGNDGRIYALDAKAQQVHIFGANGGFQKTVSRKGSGPGELREANGLIVAPDGSIWIHDHGNLRITVLSPDGDYQQQIAANARFYGWRWDGAFDAQRRLVHRILIVDGATRRLAWQTRDLRTSRLDTITINEREPEPRRSDVWQAEFPDGSRRMGAYPFRFAADPAFDPAGAEWSASLGDYRLYRVTLKGDTSASASRNVKAPEIPDAVRDAALRRIRDLLKGATKHDVDFANAPRTYPFFSQLAVDAQGRVWGRRHRADSMTAEFDVFDSSGTFQFTALLKERLGQNSRLLFTRDALFAVALDEDDLPSIIRARIPQR